MGETLQLRGTLTGHNGWVTQIATNPKFPEMILSSSRDKSLIVWKLTRDSMDSSSGGSYGIPQKRLHGHGHFVSDVVLSSDGHFALSGSWDKTLRLWDLSTGNTTRRFESHTKDVMSVAFSADNRQIVSGSRDKSIKLWNTLAQCKYTIQEEGHSDWVSCVRFSPNNQNPIIVSCGWDKYVKVGVPCIAYVLNSCKGYFKIYFNFVANKTDLFYSLGLVTPKLQAKDQSHWPHRIFEHRYNVPRWFFVCFRWQGCQGYALGFE